MWEVAIVRISVLLFLSLQIIKFLTSGSMKFSKITLFHLYFIEKDVIRGDIGSFKKVISF